MISLILACLCQQEEMRKFDPFDQWNKYKEGTSITLAMEMAQAKEMKITVTKKLSKKSDDRILLDTETTTSISGQEFKQPAEEPVLKPSAPDSTNTKCAICGQDSKGHDFGTWSDDTVKVKDKDMKVRKYVPPAKNCKGEANIGKFEMWYSDEVPGGLVMMKTDQLKMYVTDYTVVK